MLERFNEGVETFQDSDFGEAKTVRLRHKAASLEHNLDLAKQFTNMIVTQRAYSASAKIITTADEILEELIRISR